MAPSDHWTAAVTIVADAISTAGSAPTRRDQPVTTLECWLVGDHMSHPY
jgi:hypothetical protein